MDPTQAREFVKEVRVEIHQGQLADAQGAARTTVVVIVTVLLVAVFVGIVDRVLTVLVGLLFR